MVRCSISRFIYNLIPLRLFLQSCERCCDRGVAGSAALFVIAAPRGDVTDSREHLGCPYCYGGLAIPFPGLLWHFSPSVPHCCWKQKLLSNFQTQSSALWASAGRTGSTSLAAAALASCLPWIGTSRDCLSLPVSLSWRSQPGSWKSCVCNCCAWQRICFCCKPWFCYPGYVCSSYLLSALGRWMFCLFSVYWRVVNSTNLLKVPKDPVYLSVFCCLFNLTVFILSHPGAVNCCSEVSFSVCFWNTNSLFFVVPVLMLTPYVFFDFPFANRPHLVTQCTTWGLGVSWGSRTPLACVSLHSCAQIMSSLVSA